jgi:hypothetical protein
MFSVLDYDKGAFGAQHFISFSVLCGTFLLVDKGDTLGVALPPGGIILELSAGWRRWIGVASTTSTTTGLGSME